MSSKEEIKNLFISEIKNSAEYQTVLKLKTFILNEISTPNIQEEIIYNFEKPLNEEELKIFKLCMVVEFGFSTNNISCNFVFIDMKKFLF